MSELIEVDERILDQYERDLALRIINFYDDPENESATVCLEVSDDDAVYVTLDHQGKSCWKLAGCGPEGRLQRIDWVLKDIKNLRRKGISVSFV